MSGILPSYTHIINPKLKYIYLSFDQNGDLVIKSPKVPQEEIEKVLIKKAAWINKSRIKLQNKKGKPIEFREGEKIYYLGSEYPVQYSEINENYCTLDFDEDSGFKIEYGEFDPEIFEELVNRFYKAKAKQIIPGIAEKYSEKMQLFPSRITFRKAKRRWGSCSNKNSISFNYLMMKLPIKVVEYIVVHELAHIEHKHHQKEFWNLVRDYIPDYKALRTELKSYM